MRATPASSRRGLLAALLGGAVGLPLAACGTSSGSSTGTPSASATPPLRLGTPTDFSLPDAVRTVKLTTSTGATTSLAGLEGKVVALSDTMTLCEEACPLDTTSLVQTAIAENAKGLSDKVVYVSLTVDPARDDVTQIAAYRKLFAKAPDNWLMTTGPVAGVAALWKELGVMIEKVAADEGATNWRTGAKLTYDINHSDQVFFLDTRGHVRFVLDGVPAVSASAMPTTLQQYLNDEGRKNLSSPDADTWGPTDAEAVVDWLVAGA